MEALLNAVRYWQSAGAWKCAFSLVDDFRQWKKNASESWATYRETENPEWRRLGRIDDENAECCRKIALAEALKLSDIADAVRRECPSVLPLVPIVDLFDEDTPRQPEKLVRMMLELESALLLAAPPTATASVRWSADLRVKVAAKRVGVGERRLRDLSEAPDSGILKVGRGRYRVDESRYPPK